MKSINAPIAIRMESPPLGWAAGMARKREPGNTVQPTNSHVRGPKWLFLIVFLAAAPFAAAAQNPVPAWLPYPEINKDSWVMVEIWSDVKDITLAAYFLDFSYEKNRNVCEATKRVFDRDQETR